MKTLRTIITAACVAAAAIIPGRAQADNLIVIETDNNALVYNVAPDNRLYQRYLGKRLMDRNEYALMPDGPEAIITHGMEDYYEPALHINRPGANSSTLLTYTGSRTDTLADGAQRTVITLADTLFNDHISLICDVYPEHDIFKIHTQITNREARPVEIEKYASAMLHLTNSAYYLTQYNGDWASEANATETRLEYGKKQLDSKLGARADMFCSPFFRLGLDSPADETRGDILVGTLAWTGNFRFTFEVDHQNRLRVISGINPYASARILEPGQTFTTPEFIFTISGQGCGHASRNFHDWARDHQLSHGNAPPLTLLNNWEATYFDFDQQKIIDLIGQARQLGVDMFLLDDGWFGNKYPRHDDTQGLGDWTETAAKLPGGIGALTRAARDNGIRFGLWIEPEMVNPRSQLYKQHKDWVITLPGRDEYYFRNQLVLDLSNPAVQDHVYNIVDTLMTRYPDIAYLKWDCNSPITNIHSPHLHDRQAHLYTDYVLGLYNILDRIRAKYPRLQMMMCSGGGGRTDYRGLQYFTEFWPSDNTDPVERLYIQWDYSQIFPAKTLCSHVTTWNKTAPVKFRTNVAMTGKLGFDIRLDDLTPDQVSYCRRAIATYNTLRPIILQGDQYRLVSPRQGPHTATMYVGKNDGDAVLFTFDIHPRYRQRISPAEARVRLQGLNPAATYRVTETDRIDPARHTTLPDHTIGHYSGDYLMTVGLPLFTLTPLNSRLFTLTKTTP